MQKLRFTFYLIFCLSYSFSQSIIPQDVINQEIEQSIDFQSLSPFTITSQRNLQTLKEFNEPVVMELRKEAVESILYKDSKNISLSIHFSPNERRELLLYEVQMGQINVTDATTEMPYKYNGGKYFRGVVKGEYNSLVSINVFDNEINGIISIKGDNTNYVLGKLEEGDHHVLYRDSDLQHLKQFECGTTESVVYEKTQIFNNMGTRALSDCVGLYFEVDYDIYLDKGGMTETTNYITGLYNQIATLYANENINTNISEIVIWSSTSPYNATTSIGMLNQFTDYRQGFNGDLAQLLSYQASGGVAYVNTLCNGNPDYRMSFASIASSYNTVPTYSWSVMVCTHEFGHLLGSNHTHACAWNGNNTAIDGCYNTEGSCPQPPIPSGGGTIMSYCHLTNAGINFSLGFGEQPGNVIRNSVSNASCLQECSNDGGSDGDGGDNGGGCEYNEGNLTIILDNYPNETTWNIKDNNNQILYSGGPYSTAGATIQIDLCLQDDCYTFNIFDSWGDGICCGYGLGSYEIVVNGDMLVTGGQFGYSQSDSFCVDNNEPSCDDGEQNGDEEGVDCGGSDCPSCPTCNDGVQNGNEEGVDCGGDCPDCDDPPVDEEVEIFGHYFESGWDGWIDGGSDCKRYYGPKSYEGNYSIQIRDNSGAASTMTSPLFDALPYEQLNISFFFIAHSMEPNENFFIQFYDGSIWTTIADFSSGVDFVNNVFYVVNIDLNSSIVDFSNSSKLRITCDASANSDRIFIDAFTLIGLTSTGGLVENNIEIIELGHTDSSFEDITVYPNPTNNVLNVIIPDYDSETFDNSYNKMLLIDIYGRVILAKNITSKEDRLEVGDLSNGVYFLELSGVEETALKKVIISK